MSHQPWLPNTVMITDRQLFELVLANLISQYQRIEGRIGTREAEEMLRSIKRLQEYHAITWPDEHEPPTTQAQ
jgi:hypothetical protein